jgi:prepilin-type N-terminal cleavage/methylation domain-containing protein
VLCLPDRPDLLDFIGSARHARTGPDVATESGRPLKPAGFSLVEVVVATAIVAVGVASLAHLIVVSAHANRIATTTSVTLLLAEQKMEELLGEPASGPSPPGAHIDYLDSSGTSLGITMISLPSGAPPPGTAYLCRWSIAPLPDGPETAVVQVLVTPWPNTAGETRLVTVKGRKAS